MRYFLELSYNGKAYHGWQIQPNAISVQEVLEQGLSTLLKAPISVIAAGRTDTGVHANQMFAHFDYKGNLNGKELTYKLNSFLPKDIAIKEVFEVDKDSHARFDALSRTYNYRIVTSKDVFNYDFAYQVQLPIDIDLMQEASKILLDYKDFQCFSKVHTDVKTYNCDIKEAYWIKSGNEYLFTITADRFLRNMVRAIVGTLLNVGLGKINFNAIHDIIASKDRSKAGFSVPAHGLYLVNIEYPETIRIES